MNLGTNTAFFDIATMIKLNLKHLEVCLGKPQAIQENIKEIEKNIYLANINNMRVSVHLPIYLPEDYPWCFLDAHFLDDLPINRQISFDLIEDNIKRLSRYDIAYYVLHFSGQSDEKLPIDIFIDRLTSVLERMENIALKYNTKIYLEYIGSNINFYDLNAWVKYIKRYKHLGILIDICHFYFASKWRNFDFYKGLAYMRPYADAYHIWTTFGEGIYQSAEGYRKYHHIVPNLEQTVAEGWAYDTKKVIDLLMRTEKPMIIEASSNYGDFDYYRKSILDIQTYVMGKMT